MSKPGVYTAGGPSLLSTPLASQVLALPSLLPAAAPAPALLRSMVFTAHSSICLQPFPLPSLRHRLYSDATPLPRWLIPLGPNSCLGLLSLEVRNFCRLFTEPSFGGSSTVPNLFEFWAKRHFGAHAHYKVTTCLSSTVCFSTGGRGIWFSKCGSVTSIPWGTHEKCKFSSQTHPVLLMQKLWVSGPRGS